MIKNRFVQLGYRTIYIILAPLGILATWGVFKGGPLMADYFTYYTTLSNIIGFLMMLVFWFDTLRFILNKEYKGHQERLLRVKFNVNVALLITMVVFNILLKDLIPNYWTFGNLMVHLCLPLLFFFDWILFDKKNIIDIKDILYTLILPYLYLVFAMIRGLITNKYPYPFLNVNEIGYGGVALYVVLITIGFLMLSVLFYVYDKLSIDNGKIIYIKETKV